MVNHHAPINMDLATTTPINPDVMDAMRAALLADPANPESLHEAARPVLAQLDEARQAVADLIGATSEGVVFTAGEAEARNLAVKGLSSANRHRGRHIVTTQVEAEAIRFACRSVERDGGQVTWVAVDDVGRLAPQDVAAAVRDDTCLVSIHHGQAEIGTVQDVAAICQAVRRAGGDVPIHVDVTTTAAFLSVDATAWGCDAVSLGAGPLGGPRWSGALWVRPGARLHPLIEGGVQEQGKRGEHHDVPAIVGLGVAARTASASRHLNAPRLTQLTRSLIERLTEVDGVRLNGPLNDRVPGHVQVGVDGVEGESLALLLSADGLICAPGSACTSAGKSSAVLEAIGQTAPATHSAVLLTFDTRLTDADIEAAAMTFARTVARARSMGLRR